MQRNEWKFEYTAAKLAEAADTKKTHHKSRQDWWDGKKAEVMQKVREDGIEVHDSVASAYSNTKGHYGAQIEVDAGLQRDLNECHTKINEHARLVREYDGWEQVLRAHPESRLTLNHDDYLFFFGT